jgi:seryl-tRNA synthetase
MPGLINDTAAFDPVEYYTKQLPLDLARLTELRDELRKRQGAMTAVDEAQKDRDAAAAELQSAKDQAAKLMAEAKEQAAKNAAKAAQLNDREKAVEQADAVGRA